MGACRVILQMVAVILSFWVPEHNIHIEHSRRGRSCSKKQKYGAEPLGRLCMDDSKVLRKIRDDKPETKPKSQEGIEPIMMLWCRSWQFRKNIVVKQHSLEHSRPT